MIYHAGYLDGNETDVNFDHREGLVACSCGYYKLVKLPRMETARKTGRQDWQLLYVASGRAFYLWEGEAVELGRGQAMLYAPGQPQHYYYNLEDQPEVYWLHFSGRGARPLLQELELLDCGAFTPGVQERYQDLFDSIIGELQLQAAGFGWIAGGLVQELLVHMARGRGMRQGQDDPVRMAIAQMHANYREPLTVEAYAQRYNMSLCWFIRRFKAYTGVSPLQFLTGIRVDKARALLLGTSLNVGEVAALVGYDNPLYFSRIFKKATGQSPREYRRSTRTT